MAMTCIFTSSRRYVPFHEVRPDDNVDLQTMIISAAMVANIFTGFEGTAWTAWQFFAVFIGIVILWLFTVSWFLHSIWSLKLTRRRLRLFILRSHPPLLPLIHTETTASSSHLHISGYASL